MIVLHLCIFSLSSAFSPISCSNQFCEAGIGYGESGCQIPSSKILKGGTVVNAHHQEVADVYVEDGIIVAVHPNLKVSDDVTVLDATGKYVMPTESSMEGLIYIHIWLWSLWAHKPLMTSLRILSPLAVPHQQELQSLPFYCQLPGFNQTRRYIFSARHAGSLDISVSRGRAEPKYKKNHMIHYSRFDRHRAL